ncbi:uncharacterized protein LOC135476629 [Liolophura sinensis]|uniref:uncharacterized protein LOC135476629 n=1 Tax=Liolophura sinensis TaxID=3198878 RepID=UPI003158231B
MSSLVPGSLFETSGLNRRYTPTEVGLKAGDIGRKFAREPFNGHPWPRNSPVSRVYDVVNTPTKLILLNNKKTRKYSHLRGHSAYEADRLPVPDPERHFSASVSPVNKDLHIECKNSRSPRFTPTPTGVEWINQSARPPSRFSNGSMVNPRHHHSCYGHSDSPGYQLDTPAISPSTKISRLKRGPPKCNLDDTGLTWGQRSYLWSIARIYSSDNIRRQKQQQYFELLRGEIRKGGHNSDVVYRYAQYLETPRKTRCGKDTCIQRSMSAPPRTTRSTPRPRTGWDNNARTPQDHDVKRIYSKRKTKSSQSKHCDESSDISSDQSGSSLTIDTGSYRPREGTVRPKSRIGRTSNQSASKKSLSQKQAPLTQEDASKKKSEKTDQLKQHIETETFKTDTETPGLDGAEKNDKDSSPQKESNFDAKPVRSAEGKTMLETETYTEETDVVAKSRKDQVSSRKSSKSSTDLFTDSSNHGNKTSIVSHCSKDSIEAEPLSSKEYSKDIESLSTSSSNLGKESKPKVTKVRVGSATEKESVNWNKDTTIPSNRSSIVASSNSSQTSVISRNESSDVLNRTSASQSLLGNKENQEAIEKEKIPEADSKKEILILSESSNDKETLVKTEKKIDNDFSSGEEGNYQNSRSSTTQDHPEKPQTESTLSNEMIVNVNENDQDYNSKVAETALTESSKKDTEKEVVLGYKETWDPLIGRVSPIPSIGSDDLEPVDPELLEY